LTGTYSDGKGDSANAMIFTVYVDGATKPTYTFTPAQLIGVGFNDETAPWVCNNKLEKWRQSEKVLY
jgi:hypothetical protein